jgi:hypothetical protein
MEFCCILLAKSNNLSHQLGAYLIAHVALTCVKPLQIQNGRSRALLFVTPTQVPIWDLDYHDRPQKAFLSLSRLHSPPI